MRTPIWTLAAILAAGLYTLLPAQEEPSGPITYTDTTTRSRARCHAGTGEADTNALGGFWASENTPDEAPEGVGQAGQINLVAFPRQTLAVDPDSPDQATTGRMVLLLVNRTGQTQWFRASDSRLQIVQEAQDAEGSWRPVEYLPQSWCGNSHHRVALPGGQAWTFSPARYRGPFETRLRFRLQQPDGEDILSNEFAGSIDPGQFGEKQGHTPKNLMDPYDE